MTRTTRTTQSGFVLIEAIVAIGVCVLMVVGALGLMQRSAQSTRHATDVVIASYLAQDALEWAIAKNDFNQFQSSSWLNEMLPIGSGDYGVDTRGEIEETYVEECGAAGLNACVLQYNPTNGVYGYGAYAYSGGIVSTSPLSPYKRVIQIDSSLNGGNEALITVTVSWDEGGRTESLSINHRLYKY